MPPNRIVLLTGNPLRSNPRVIKEAAALTEEGYEVQVLGAWSAERVSEFGGRIADGGGQIAEGGWRRAGSGSEDSRSEAETGRRRDQRSEEGDRRAEIRGVEIDMLLAEQGRYNFVPLLPPNTLEGKLHRLVQRASRRFMPWSKWTFGLMPLVLEREALPLKPDLVIAHSEPALFAALALHRRGIKVGLDMEDWFSEDLLPETRSRRPVDLLRKAEHDLLRCAAHATCTTEAMADALVRAYGCPRPTRIYNVFPSPRDAGPELRDRGATSRSLAGEPSRGRAAVSIHWFSQTLGPGRGLEELMEAATGLHGNFEIHLRGENGAYRVWFDDLVPADLRSRVFVHAPVPAGELPSRIAEHDIGFAGELSGIRSRDLTATNKIFQYLQGGLAVVASDTAGQHEVAGLAGPAVAIYRSGSTDDLGKRLADLIENADKLAASKNAAADAASRSLHWAAEKPRLVASVHRALDGK